MRTPVLALAALLLAPALAAQTLSVTTDKAVYASGEPVVVTIRLDNRTDQPIMVGMPASLFSCGLDFMLDGFWRWESRCLPAETQEVLPARSAFVWTRTLDPVETGLFGSGGFHTVRASFYGADSVTFEAAAYQGGVLEASYLAQDSLHAQAVRESLRATVRKQRGYTSSSAPPSVVAEWVVRGQSTDSVMMQYAQDARLNLRAVRKLGLLAFRQIVGTDGRAGVQAGHLGEPVPQPFGGQAVLTFTLGQSGAVTADLYDALGQHVQRVYRGAAVAGEALRLTVPGAGLSAGVYVLRVQASGATYVQRLVRAAR